ncbi:hypothetical protein BSQ35_03865 [Serratia liquefaciens]|nr:hypothetical protein BSQ35_03865 [Serratia liquefaciens]
MRKVKLMICSVMLPMAVAGCGSAPRVQPPPPPAWLMQTAPDLLTPLNGIITPSESELKPPTAK